MPFLSNESSLGSTTTYSIQIAHAHTEGIAANPIAGPAPKNASLVRLHAPFEMISVYYLCISEGKPPVVPSEKSFVTNPNRVFIGGERVGMITPAITGHTFVMAGRLDYCVVGPEGLSSTFALAKTPWELTSVSEYAIPPQNFLTGIINPNSLEPYGLAPDLDAIQLNTNLLTAIQG